MEIKSTNIRVQASKNYQVFEISFEATCESSNEIESLKSAAIKYAIKGINELCGEKETPEVKATVVSQPIVQQPIEQPQGPVLGEIRVFNGFAYKYAHSDKTQQYYWILANQDDVQRGAPKYYKEK